MNNGDFVSVGGGRHICDFFDVISIKNLLKAWYKFSKGKKSKTEVSKFELNLEENLFTLYQDVISFEWNPKPYISFKICDPKLREIHKADIGDMVLYQAVHQSLYQIFNPVFIFDSYSSRETKGTHAGVCRLEEFARKVSKNYTKRVYILKCDIRKFFDNIDHKILLNLIEREVWNKNLMSLIERIVFSFEKKNGKGLPLGNVTSQLFSNIYLNELDQFVKHKLKAKYYIRYCDDFVILSDKIDFIDFCLKEISKFCKKELLIELHQNKVSIRKINSGVDFLGYVCLPHRKVLRTRTKRRILSKIEKIKCSFDAGVFDEKVLSSKINSYLGIIKHCKGEKIKEQINKILFD